MVESSVRIISTLCSKIKPGKAPLLPGSEGEAKRKETRMPPKNEDRLESEREFYASFRRDLAAFKKRLPRLLKRFPGEYVAILDGRVVDHKSRWEDIVDHTQKRYPDRFVLLEKVAPRTNQVVNMDTLEV